MLTPVQALEVDRRQAALTRRFLLPALPALEATFLEIRAETDRALASVSQARRGKAYPYGYCFEIATDALSRLRPWVAKPRSPGERALKAFLDQGGQGRVIWGVLRDRYFQNAIQLGSLYVDVANDTVDITKPKVEILPMAASGMTLVSDGAHFARIAESYWDVRAYANTILPALAPAFPVVLVDKEQSILLQSRSDYMIALFAANGFQHAEAWLRDGPPPPAVVVEALRRECPEDILALNPETGVAAALEACQALAKGKAKVDRAWIARMCALFDRVPIVRFSESKPAGVSDATRVNARGEEGVRPSRILGNQGLNFRTLEQNRNIFLSPGK